MIIKPEELKIVYEKEDDGRIRPVYFIDAEPVRHGYWIERYGVHEGKYYKCSACNYNCSHTKENYCSYCGTKMDG